MSFKKIHLSLTFHPFSGLMVKKNHDQTDQFLAELPEEVLVSLFFSLIRMRQQMEDEYYANPTKILAGAVFKLKQMILIVRDVIVETSQG